MRYLLKMSQAIRKEVLSMFSATTILCSTTLKAERMRETDLRKRSSLRRTIFKGVIWVGILCALYLGEQSAIGQERASEQGTLFARQAVRSALLALEAPRAEAWPEALRTLRKHPETARATLLRNLQQGAAEAPERFMRVFAEWAKAADLPQLTPLCASPRFSAQLCGSMLGRLYRPARPATRTILLRRFAFVQSGSAIQGEGQSGSYGFLPSALVLWHARGLPPLQIEELRPWTQRSFPNSARFTSALRAALASSFWKSEGNFLLGTAAQLPTRIRLHGRLRSTFFNPLTRPLLIRSALHAWGGEAQVAEWPRWIWLNAGETRNLNLSAVLLGARERKELRLDLRLWEVNQGLLPGHQSLRPQLNATQP